MKKIFSLVLINGAKFLITIGAPGALLLVGCTTQGTNWDVDAYAPVAETTLDLSKMIGDDNLQAYADSSAWLNIDIDNVFSFTLDTLTEFPSFQVPYNYIWTLPTVSFPAGNSIPTLISPIDISANGIELREIKLKKGKLILDLKSSATERSVFTYSMPAATIGGVAFTFTDTVDALGDLDTVYYSKEFDLSDYLIITTGPGNDELNTFSTYIDVHSIAGDPNMTLTTNQVVFSITNKMEDMILSYGKGYLGQYDLSQSNVSANIDAIKAFKLGLIDIEQLSLQLMIKNYIGAEIRFKPIYLKATNTNNGNFLKLTHPLMGSTVNINRAFETGIIANPINPFLYTYTFNSANSDLEQIVELLPDRFDFSADMNLNPYGNMGGYTDFYYTDYPAHVQMKLQAPLKFYISELMFLDTITNPFASLDLLDNVVDGQFIIRAENKFPIAMNLQLYTLDTIGNITDSVLVNDLIVAAPVNVLNRVTAPLTTDLIVIVNAAKIMSLKSATNIRIKAMFNTQPAIAGRLQMYIDYYLKIKLIADIKYHIVL